MEIRQASSLKKFISYLLLVIFLLNPTSACTFTETPPPHTEDPQIPTVTPSPVILTLGSWRTEDTGQMNIILDKFHERHPNIYIQFDPITRELYDQSILAQLEEGTAPDLFYLRSSTSTRQLYEKGYVELLDTVPGIMENYLPDTLTPWINDNGKPYGLPLIASSHGIYYNQNIFNEVDVKVPGTWEELLQVSQKIKEAGYTPFANATGDSWTAAELIFMSLVPNFIGGKAGRMEYLEGNRCFNDQHIIDVFEAIRQISYYLPKNQDDLKYEDSQQLFLQGEAAMFIDGSWDISYFTTQQPSFTWSIFAIPAPKGKPAYINFMPDAAIGLNHLSKNKEEAMVFLEWLETDEFVDEFDNQLPGLFPMRKDPPTPNNQYARIFLDFNLTHETDIRFTWEKLSDGSPNGYTLIEEAATAVMYRRMTPQQAANHLQKGLAQWYKPAQECDN